MSNKIILVIGGSRSGKSEFAENLMYRFNGERKGYIATSRVLDDEMKYRVLLHKKRRPSAWQTFEVFHKAGDVMENILLKTDTLLLSLIHI